MIVKKITVGYVVQLYDTDTKKCFGQNFIDGHFFRTGEGPSHVYWEDIYGNAIRSPDDLPNCSLDMAQPYMGGIA